MQAFIIMNSQFGIKSFKLLKNTICYILNILNIYVYISDLHFLSSTSHIFLKRAFSLF